MARYVWHAALRADRRTDQRPWSRNATAPLQWGPAAASVLRRSTSQRPCQRRPCWMCCVPAAQVGRVRVTHIQRYQRSISCTTQDEDRNRIGHLHPFRPASATCPHGRPDGGTSHHRRGLGGMVHGRTPPGHPVARPAARRSARGLRPCTYRLSRVCRLCRLVPNSTPSKQRIP